MVGYAGHAAAQVVNPPTKFMTKYCTNISFSGGMHEDNNGL